MSHTANNPSICDLEGAERRPTAGRQGRLSLTSDAQPYYDDCSTRDAVALNGQNIGDVLNGRGLSWGWFQGGERPSTSYTDALAATGGRGQPTSMFTPGSVQERRLSRDGAHSSNQGICDALHLVGVALGGTVSGATRTTTSRTTSRSILRLDGEPAPPDDPDRRCRERHAHRASEHRARYAELQERHAPVQHAQPPVRHERFRSARVGDPEPPSCPRRRCRRSASSRRRATRTATRRTRIRPMSSSSSLTRSTRSSARRTGRARR